MVSLCSEFLDAGTDTTSTALQWIMTSTALQWIMANLIKYPRVQTNLYEEIHGIVGPSPQLEGKNEKEVMVMIKEEDLLRMCYLKSVILEGLSATTDLFDVTRRREIKMMPFGGREEDLFDTSLGVASLFSWQIWFGILKGVL
ncbi:hypothetical protein C3L33_03493, partial [Rhododendron williamsianum]